MTKTMTPSYALGLAFIVLVSVIWAAASVLVQHLYRDMDFDSPFLLTYVSTSLFVLFLPSRLIWERRAAFLRRASCRGGVEVVEEEEEDGIIPWRNDHDDVATEEPEYTTVPSVHDGNEATTTTAGFEMGRTTTSSASGSGSGGGGPVYRAIESGGADGDDGGGPHGLTERDPGAIPEPWKTPSPSSRGSERSGGASSLQRSEARPRVVDKDAGAGGGDGDGLGVSLSVPSLRAASLDSDSWDPNDASSSSLIPADPDDDDDINKGPGTTMETTAESGSAEEEATTIRRRRRDPDRPLAHVDHMRMALKIAPVWFLSNYLYNTSLAYTSISSSTVLASTGSLFTFLFAVWSGDERPGGYKMAGVALCFAGSVLTGLGDADNGGDGGGGGGATAEGGGGNLTHSEGEFEGGRQPAAAPDDGAVAPDRDDGAHLPANAQLWGDAMGLASAAGYGAYTVLIRKLCPRDESLMSMQLLLGYIGLINGLALSPVAVKIIFFGACPASAVDGTSDESDGDADEFGLGASSPPTLSSGGAGDGEPATASCETLTLVVFAFLLLKAFFDNVLSDYLWARAVVLTSATVATVGLGLTIPLAFLSDFLLGHDSVVTARSVAGALGVLFGFVLVNCGEGLEDDKEEGW